MNKHMKTTLPAILLLSGFAVFPITAATPNEKRLTMEQRISDTDISVDLKHYETVRMELLNARLKRELAEAEQTGTTAERETQSKTLAQKIEILERYAKTLREGLLKAGQFAASSGGRN
jgi:hypothetical protein